MTNTPTQDVEATVAQIRRLVAAGRQIVRVAVPNLEAAKAVGKIKEQIDLPPGGGHPLRLPPGPGVRGGRGR